MDLNRRHKLTKEEKEHVKKITNSGRLYYDYDPLIESARNLPMRRVDTTTAMKRTLTN